jgi:hypothetical protein
MSERQRKPMNRGTGFHRPELVRPASPAPTRATRIGVIADCSVMAEPIEKTEAHRNRHLLDMARGRPCLFRIPGVCNFDPDTTVACHSNLGAHGKGGARKADDEYTAWGCARCHTWLDSSYSAAGEEREEAFLLAHVAQIDEWAAIAISAAADPKDRLAARWALMHLNVETP